MVLEREREYEHAGFQVPSRLRMPPPSQLGHVLRVITSFDLSNILCAEPLEQPEVIVLNRPFDRLHRSDVPLTTGFEARHLSQGLVCEMPECELPLDLCLGLRNGPCKIDGSGARLNSRRFASAFYQVFFSIAVPQPEVPSIANTGPCRLTSLYRFDRLEIGFCCLH